MLDIIVASIVVIGAVFLLVALPIAFVGAWRGWLVPKGKQGEPSSTELNQW